METEFYKGKGRNALTFGLLLFIALLPSKAFADCSATHWFNNYTSPFRPSAIFGISSSVRCMQTEFKNYTTKDDKKKRLEEGLVHVEHALRAKGKEACEYLKNNKDAADRPSYQRGIKTIQRTISFSGCDELYQTFDDYDQFLATFNIGYEYAAINSLFKQGFPRLGFMVYMRHWEDEIVDNESGWSWGYGVHQSFTAQLTGSAEQATTSSAFSNNSTINMGDKRSLEFETSAFLPMYRSKKINHVKLWEYVGPVISVGGKKVDEDPRAAIRLYRGLRLAMTPEWYTDIMYGETEGLTHRVEVKGQLPISDSLNNSRVFLGAIGNFGIGDDREKEADVIRVYLTWNVNVEDVFKAAGK